MTEDPKIAIIVINWNGRDDTLECLASVRQVDYPHFEVIVVDNGSSDNSVEAIRNAFPEVTVIETRENLGFAGGNNVGMRHALKNRSEYIFLLNNDTVVDSQILKSFIRSSRLLPRDAILSAKIYYYSNPDKIWYAGAKWVGSSFIHVGLGSYDDGHTFDSIAETDYACGCALFVCTELVKKIGLLDERFFLTFEETDFCYRARGEGFKSYVVPEAKVWHKVSISFGGEGSPLFQYFIARNRLLWGEKNLPFPDRLALYKQVAYEVFRAFFPRMIRRLRQGNASFFRQISISMPDYRKSFREALSDPKQKARLFGIYDYVVRRFGNCPESVRALKIL